MKAIQTLIATLLIFIFAAQLLIAQNYKSQFDVNEKGEVKNGSGVSLGSIGSDGIIKDNKGIVVGKVVKGKKSVDFSDKSGGKVGTVRPDGSLLDTKGDVIFTISTADEQGTCKISNSNGEVVGTVHENYKQQGACAFHCLSKSK